MEVNDEKFSRSFSSTGRKGGDQILKILLCSILLFNKRVVQPTSMAYVKCMYEKGQIMWIMILTSCARFSQWKIYKLQMKFSCFYLKQQPLKQSNVELTRNFLKQRKSGRLKKLRDVRIFALYRFGIRISPCFGSSSKSKQPSSFCQSRAVQKRVRRAEKSASFGLLLFLSFPLGVQ